MSVAILGLILLAAAATLAVAVVTSNTDAVGVNLWGASMSNLSLGVIFVAGMITTVIAVAGLALVMGGLRRGNRLRKERKVLRRENRRLSRQVGTSTPSADTNLVRPTGRGATDEPVTEAVPEGSTEGRPASAPSPS